MPLTTATHDQVSQLTQDIGAATPALRRARTGATEFPLRTEDRVPLVNLLNAVTHDLEELGFIAPGGPALGPNDVVLDSTLPVPVRDQDTSVVGTAHITILNTGEPIVGFTGEDVTLVKSGQVVPVGDPMVQKYTHSGTMSTPDLRLKFGAGTLSVASGDKVMVTTQGGAANIQAACSGIHGHPGETYGGVAQITLPQNLAMVNVGGFFNVYDFKQTRYAAGSLPGTGTLVSAVKLPGTAALVVQGDQIANPMGGGYLTATVVDGVLTLTL